MTESMCPSLGRLGTLLQTAYARRDRCLADNKNMEAICEAERNLRRIHNLEPVVVEPLKGHLALQNAEISGR